MYKQPGLIWEGDFPYNILAQAGITPNSTMREIDAAMFFFMERGGEEKVHQIINNMTKTRGRLFYDFFLYRMNVIEDNKDE